jgi:non-specific serine/threonine protein kinase
MTILSEYLRHRQMLLVLDDCEHLLGASAVLIDGVLRAAPELRVLVTSRQALGVTGESLFAVPPLPVPDPEAVLNAGAAIEYPALALFAERASAVVREFTITGDNLAAIHVTPSFSLMSARRICFWTLPVAVMGRDDTISRRSGSFCVASFCSRR